MSQRVGTFLFMLSAGLALATAAGGIEYILTGDFGPMIGCFAGVVIVAFISMIMDE